MQTLAHSDKNHTYSTVQVEGIGAAAQCLGFRVQFRVQGSNSYDKKDALPWDHVGASRFGSPHIARQNAATLGFYSGDNSIQ